jgi:hypothetical protein
MKYKEAKKVNKKIEEAVKARYGSFAGSGLSSERSGVRSVAEAFGYSPEELRSIPAEANMGILLPTRISARAKLWSTSAVAAAWTFFWLLIRSG